MHALWNNIEEHESQTEDYLHFLDVITQLEWLKSFLKEAAEFLKVQPPKWSAAERQEQRIFHAFFLSSVFEWSFSKNPTVISWNDALEGLWPDFFRRIMRLVFNEPKTPNLRLVLDEARRRYKDTGAPFDPKSLTE